MTWSRTKDRTRNTQAAGPLRRGEIYCRAQCIAVLDGDHSEAALNYRADCLLGLVHIVSHPLRVRRAPNSRRVRAGRGSALFLCEIALTCLKRPASRPNNQIICGQASLFASSKLPVPHKNFPVRTSREFHSKPRKITA